MSLKNMNKNEMSNKYKIEAEDEDKIYGRCILLTRLKFRFDGKEMLLL